MKTDIGTVGEIVLYQTEGGQARIECRFVDENIWLTQKLIADLFQKDVRTVNEHLRNIYDEGELAVVATIRKFRIVRFEGGREVARSVDHYNLEAILAVGYRVRSAQSARFRQWATAQLKERLVKGFLLDDQRLKNPDGRPDYFDEVLERIRSRVYPQIVQTLPAQSALKSTWQPVEVAWSKCIKGASHADI